MHEVVPYHPETLMIWNAHMNAQYVTSKGFARYITKYIAKAEPHKYMVLRNPGPITINLRTYHPKKSA